MSHSQTVVPRRMGLIPQQPRWVKMTLWANYLAFVSSSLLAGEHKFALIPAMVSLLTMWVLSKAQSVRAVCGCSCCR